MCVCAIAGPAQCGGIIHLSRYPGSLTFTASLTVPLSKIYYFASYRLHSHLRNKELYIITYHVLKLYIDFNTSLLYPQSQTLKKTSLTMFCASRSPWGLCSLGNEYSNSNDTCYKSYQGRSLEGLQVIYSTSASAITLIYNKRN